MSEVSSWSLVQFNYGILPLWMNGLRVDRHVLDDVRMHLDGTTVFRGDLDLDSEGDETTTMCREACNRCKHVLIDAMLPKKRRK